MKKYIRPQSTVLAIMTEGLIAGSDSDSENLGGSVKGTVTTQDDYANKYIWNKSEWTEE